MTRPTSSTAPDRRNLFLIGGVIALAVIGALGALFVLNRAPQTVAPSALASPSARASTPASQALSTSEAPIDSAPPAETPGPTPLAAPEEWTLVHEFGPDGTRWVGGEIAHGDAGFLAVGRRWESGEGGPRITENGMWLSADGREWTEVPYPIAETGDPYLMALTGAADGSYVFHGQVQGPQGGPISVSLRSTDGTTWEEIATGLPEAIFVQAIEQGPSGYLLLGGQGTGQNPGLWLSADALTWELVHEFDQEAQFVQLHDGDGGAEGYVVIGRRIEPDGGPYQRFTFASADGREWFERPEPFGPDNQEFVGDVAVSSLGSDWVATLGQPDETTRSWTSSDGLTWTEAGVLPIRNQDVALAGLLEEVGDEVIDSPGGGMDFAGTTGAFSSTDGAAWAPLDLGADAWLGELAIGGGIVAVTGTIPGEGFTSTGAIWIRAAD